MHPASRKAQAASPRLQDGRSPFPGERFYCPQMAETLEDIPRPLQREITHFFSIYKELEEKKVDVEGWRSREEALEVIEDAKRLQEQADREAG